MGPFEHLRLIPKPDLRIIDDFVVHWHGKRAGRIAPRAAEIETPELGAHLHSSFIVDVIERGEDFRYRFIGSRLIESVGRDCTGHCVRSLYRGQPEALATILDVFDLPVRQKCPIYVRGHIFWLPCRDGREFTAGLLPLSEDGFEVDAIFAELFVLSPEVGPG